MCPIYWTLSLIHIYKAAVATQRMKQAYIATKEKAERSVNANSSSAEEYASDKLESGIDEVVHDGAYALSLIHILRSSPAKSRKTFAMSFQKREMRWRIFPPVFPMSFTRKRRHEAQTTKAQVRLWRRKTCIISHWTCLLYTSRCV